MISENDKLKDLCEETDVYIFVESSKCRILLCLELFLFKQHLKGFWQYARLLS